MRLAKIQLAKAQLAVAQWLAPASAGIVGALTRRPDQRGGMRLRRIANPAGALATISVWLALVG